jgi:hypothetical protein
MRKKRQARQRAGLQHPSHWFEPQDLLSFIELRPFTRRWLRLGLTDRDLELLQVTIMTHPKCGDVIEGTGGVRKVRFSPPQWKTGKSGALRISYAFFEEVGTVVLGIVFTKDEKDNLTDDEKSILRIATDRIKKLLLSRPYRTNSKRRITSL